MLCNRKVTLADSIERCLKRGKGDEQTAAAVCAILLMIQLGSGEDGDETLRSLYPVLKVIMLDNSASYAARAAVSFIIVTSYCCQIILSETCFLFNLF